MTLDTEFWIQLLVYLLPLAAMWGQIMTRLKYLEEKTDKHNSVIERMAIAERDLKSAWRAIDEIKEDCHD